jgi:hypothetical protein
MSKRRQILQMVDMEGSLWPNVGVRKENSAFPADGRRVFDRRALTYPTLDK